MKTNKLTLFFALLFLSFPAFAQEATPLENQIANFNGFQRTKEHFPDSAIVYLKNLSLQEPKSAEDLIHNSFAQIFLNVFQEKMVHDSTFLATIKQMNITVDSVLSKMNAEKKIARLILLKLKNDQSTFIKNNFAPIVQWVDAQDNSKNPDKLFEIGNSYLSYLTLSGDIYAQRKARYGLLIAQLLAKHSNTQPLADKISILIYNQLKDQQVTGEFADNSRNVLEKRAWYRYMFAYSNFIFAQNLNLNQEQKLAYLKLGYEYSPDNIDKKVKSAYFYDGFFLTGEEKHSFEEEYLAALSKDEDRYKILLRMSMNDPKFKAKAKTLSNDPKKFKEVWLNEFNKSFKQAPIFSLKQTDGIQYNLMSDKNKWTLVDFWGTWCAPCREEHPALQKLYDRTKNGNLPNLNIITIASRDNETAVNNYVKEFKYNFPVAMSDNLIEEDYKVSSWPSKYLVSPQGKYVTIPFGVDWIKYVEDYIN
jgi:thiol-disulfide isomerase/thioredoxin